NYVDKINELKERELVIIGSYAALNKRKGIDQIVRLLDIRDDLSLVFIGEGKEIKNLQYLAQSLGVADRLVFLPYTLKPYGYVHLFDIYAMPSRSEGFGLALVEAALTKTSIICSDIPVFHEIFNEDEVSYFKLEDIDSLNVAVTEALNKRSLKSNNAFEKGKKI
ncbi:glycosyltransferase, partial [Flavobacterium sp. YO12]|uniref:glycosyltransferase n=1 Tax=Flavobacterium sp. YO12 TaxID=1920029 RepID=UPI00100A2E91